MHLFDTHVHVEGSDTTGMLTRAREAGVGRIVAVGGSEEANSAALTAARHNADLIRCAVGFDREQVRHGLTDSTAVESALSGIRAMVSGSEGSIVAIGEIGLDFHYSPDMAESQKMLFLAQLALARELELPVVVHSREAEDTTIALLKEHVEAWPGRSDGIGVLHCFSGDAEFAGRLAGLGLYISFSGLITFKNASVLREAALSVPDDRLLIETDTPYLAPVPYRGRPNEPSYVRYVAEALAEIKGRTVEDIAALTAANGKRLFDR
jgi:TatD DNase family protein